MTNVKPVLILNPGELKKLKWQLVYFPTAKGKKGRDYNIFWCHGLLTSKVEK